MVSKSAMNLILGFVGKTHARKKYRAFDLSDFGAKACYTKGQENCDHQAILSYRNYQATLSFA
ncbi:MULTISPECIES: hypothetical protein [Vibrio]|uniref:hypothetical protein n=1 Tax=Vibrio TaxID=662 RepID=UPI000066FCC2|nr:MULTISPECIES: hypothetical protein [Vibrio]EAP95635.1 hypothetical protein V12B01_02565 [Vibrio splendidus 12B01]PMJ63168.1 hypothetical protein BCU18_20140 [Vibrio lentus]